MSAHEPSQETWLSVLSKPVNIISAAKWGVIIGVAYYAVAVGTSALVNVLAGSGSIDVSKNPLPLLPTCIGLFAYVFALYVAGYMPATETSHIAPGMLGAVVMLVVARVLQSIYSPAPSSSGVGSAATQIISYLIFLAIALSLGYLGAFYGLKRNKRATPTA